jgi:hypothetical protein
LTVTLLVTVIIESTVVIGYSRWGKKPAKPLLVTSIAGNLLTQSLLWVGLNLFFRNYLVALLIAEILIWILETILLYVIRLNHLNLREASLLSLAMNGLSFALGWFLPL